MTPQECEEHRSRIGFEAEVVLQGYWQADLEKHLKAAVMADWADELEDWPIDQIRWALREYRRENPRRKPNPGDILSVLKKRRGEQWAAKRSQEQAAADPQPVVTDEDRARAKEFMAEKFPHLVKPIPEVRE